VVGGVHHGVLEATGVREVQMQLAVLTLVRSDGSRANIGLEGIEAPSNDSLVVRGRGRNGALRASATRVGSVADGDLVWRGCNSTRLRVSRSKDGKGENSELGMHLEEKSESGGEPSEWC
jgi:hypothetical protein